MLELIRKIHTLETTDQNKIKIIRMVKFMVISRNLQITTRLLDTLQEDKSLQLKEYWLRINKWGSSRTKTYSKSSLRTRWSMEVVFQHSLNWSQNASLEAGLSVSFTRQLPLFFPHFSIWSECFDHNLFGVIKFINNTN